MTETTEGLTRRMSSGSDSPSARAVAAAKKKRATSASHGGSLRFNISGAFFSKKEFGTGGFLGSVGAGFNGRNPTAARRALRRRRPAIMPGFAQMSTVLCRNCVRCGFVKDFANSGKRRGPLPPWERPPPPLSRGGLRLTDDRADHVARGGIALGLERDEEAEIV